MKHSIFKDNIYQEQLDRDGYVVFPFLDENEKQLFLDFYNKYKSELSYRNGLHITFDNSTEKLFLKISQEVRSLFKAPSKRIFENEQLFLGGFINKAKKSNENRVFIHQDYHFVDEQNGYFSGTFWVPLLNILKDTAPLDILVGSHREYFENKGYKIFTGFRCPPSYKYDSPFDISSEDIKSKMKTITMNFGEALIWDHRVLHASNPNLSDKDRIVLGCAITHKNATFQMMYRMPMYENRVGLYETDVNFINSLTLDKINKIYESNQHLTGNAPIKIFNLENSLEEEQVEEKNIKKQETRFLDKLKFWKKK